MRACVLKKFTKRLTAGSASNSCQWNAGIRSLAHYMRLADFFIGKRGPGSISEALQCRLPVIVERNSKTMSQERYNGQWVTERGLGIVLSVMRSIFLGVAP